MYLIVHQFLMFKKKCISLFVFTRRINFRLLSDYHKHNIDNLQ